MKTIEKIAKITKDILKVGTMFYFLGGSVYGCGDFVSGGTTGHLSADLYTGRKKPSKFTEKTIRLFDENYKFGKGKIK